MRTISSSKISKAVEKLAMDCNYYLPHDVVKTLKSFALKEKNKKAKNALYKIIENHKIAKNGVYPLCQDTGICVVFVEFGTSARVDGDIYKAINEGVKSGYKKGYLRKSTADPLSRVNTGTNTPAIIHLELKPGEKIKISLMAKGAGAENKSKIKMLNPSDGEEGIMDFALRTVEKAGASACPPYVIGIGIGGNLETAPLLAKKALLRPVDDTNKNKKTAKLEKQILAEINTLGTGPMGFGGTTTAIGVKIETAPCHIASLPVAVNIQCHSARHKTITL